MHKGDVATDEMSRNEVNMNEKGRNKVSMNLTNRKEKFFRRLSTGMRRVLKKLMEVR